MADIKVGQLWGVDWPDRDPINPAVRGKSVGYRVVEVCRIGPKGTGAYVRNVKTNEIHGFIMSKTTPPHWKLIEDVP